MPLWAWILCACWSGICNVWGFLFIAQFQVRRGGLFLRPETQADFDETRGGTPWPTVSVVIPARNEASQLASCLEAVLQQDYPALSVVVVDDRSEDETAAIAEEFARRDSRLRVKRIETLPAGWLGKSYALWSATRDVDSDWILFIDVDCLLDPAAVRTALAEAQRCQVQFLTLWPRNRAIGFWEHMTIPLCAGIVALWFGTKRVNDPNSPRALGMGAFLLIVREAYERMGGHESVRTALIEDVPFAEKAKQAGIRCRVASGRDIASVRMYTGYKAICDGWARIYVGALRSPMKIALSVAWLLFGSLLPYIVGIVLLLLIPTASRSGWLYETSFVVPAGLCVSHLALIAVVSFRFWGFGHCKRVYLWLYPLSVVVVMGILVRAWWWLAIRRSVSWRRTRYIIDGSGAIVR